jgi:hypothetical protein
VAIQGHFVKHTSGLRNAVLFARIVIPKRKPVLIPKFSAISFCSRTNKLMGPTLPRGCQSAFESPFCIPFVGFRPMAGEGPALPVR